MEADERGTTSDDDDDGADDDTVVPAPAAVLVKEWRRRDEEGEEEPPLPEGAGTVGTTKTLLPPRLLSLRLEEAAAAPASLDNDEEAERLRLA